MSLVDVVPTVLSVLGVPPPPGIDGVDLSPTWRGGSAAPGRLLYAEAGAPGLRSVRSGRHKLIMRGAGADAELYDLLEDAGETRNLAAAQPELVASLRFEIDRFLQSARAPQPAPELTDEEKAHLRSLGYLSASASEPAASSDGESP